MTTPAIKLELGVDPSRAGEFICEICGTRRDRNGVCLDLAAEGLRFAICCECAAAGSQKTGKNLRERVRYLRLKAGKLERLAAALSRTKPGPLTRIFQAAAAIGSVDEKRAKP